MKIKIEPSTKNLRKALKKVPKEIKFGWNKPKTAMIAKVQNYGNPNNLIFGKYPAPIPPRPFMTHSKQEIIKDFKMRYNKKSLKMSYILFSKRGTTIIKKNIKAKNKWQKNSAVTIKLKGFNNPLVDSGKMMNTTDSEIIK